MANILFLMRYPLGFDDNLKTKFDGQMNAARALGHEVDCIGWDHTGMWLVGKQGERKLLLRSLLTAMPAYQTTFLYTDLMAALRKAALNKKYDLVYMRYMPTFSGAPEALAAAKARGAKLVLEHPTYPFEHGKTTSLLRRPAFMMSDRVFQRIEPLIDLYALIGDPAGETLHGVPAINIVNGVDVARFPLHIARKQTAEVGMLALASMSVWQGYDRLIEALAAYAGDASVTVHMVGGEGDGSLEAWKRLAEKRGVAERVVFHGELHGEALDAVVAACDIGVGGLGLYRKGQLCSMTLKLREYMARGLPFAYAVDDPSIPEEPRFCIRLKNDDSAIDMNELVDFARAAKHDEAVSADMRLYARDHMSWRSELSRVLERVGIA